ncbi:MAG: carboxypeptidase regulatory-like domain-containing protein [Acidobacteria bacterium]|nr:carboxypeptidase regulatory-like domain-containing protein [Acidobacteriota bacterium]
MAAVSSVSAQDLRGKVQGLVKDPTNAVIAGATVTLRNVDTGIQSISQTTSLGQYIFDFVQPGNYSVTVEMPGFKLFAQQNLLVQARADITVNATLEIGNTRETVTVESAPVAVQFNTTTMGMTLDTKMANSLPVANRNPFLLVALNPAVVVRSSTEQSPYHHWAASQFDVGGNTNTKNDIILDGAPSMTSQKSSYTPPMDAVQEVNLQQNAVDAEFGHSAGGVISMQMKSGTNAFHGTAYYLMRNPVANALADRVTRGKNLTRQNVWGVTQGNPILKNKLFNFFAYEGTRLSAPIITQNTLPTSAERTGDFSRSLNTQGGLRTIYDPFTTQTAGNVITRTPFAGNIIPQSRFDPTSKIMLGDLWQPNRDGVNVNNFAKSFANRFRYWNVMDRVDYNISDKLKVFGRFNKFNTFTKWDDFTGGAAAQPVDGSKRHAITYSGDAVYTINSSTVVNVRGAYNAIVDSFGVPEATLKATDLEKFWAGNSWYKAYLNDLPDIYYPGVTVNAYSSTTLGKTGYWFQEPNSYNIESKMSKNVGRHFMKAGGEFRKERTAAARPRPMAFVFNPALTSNTYNAPNTALSGDAWATFLLGALDGGSSISSIPIQRPVVDFVGLFWQDDIKLNSRLTLNVGLRYEFFTAMRDPERRLSRYLDLTVPIPDFQGANAPRLPTQATSLRTSNPIYNGAWNFTDDDNPNSWNAPKGLFMPRLGLAWRVDNNTALRIGYARYIVPATLTDGLNILGSVPYPGFDANSTTIGPLQGIPQQRLNNPFPGGLVPVSGKSLGTYTNLGTATTWYQQDFNPGVNDRINISVQRQLPFRILSDTTFFMNIGRNHPYNYDVNQVDPRIGFRVQNAVQASVPNPFFNLLPATKMPGQLRTQANVAVSELLRPYPQYNSLTETLRGGIGNRYRSLQLQFQRPFVSGFNLVAGYNYNNSRNEEFYDNVDNFTNSLTWQPAPQARHRLTGAAIYQLPFGKGRSMMGNAHPVLDALLGGWAASTLFTYNSGAYLRFGGMLVDGDPGISNPTSGQWFDTSKFKVLPAFTRRTNPLQYDSVKGPRFVNVDATLSKDFNIIRERLKFELRGEAYNLLNSWTAADPNTAVTNAQFGKLVSSRAGIYGRQIQFSGRFIW